MEIAIRVDCSPTEARRLLGQPDLLPLYEVVSLAQELSLMTLVTRAGEASMVGTGKVTPQSTAGNNES